VKPKTVLHLIDALNFGGAQQLLVLLAQWTPQPAFKTIVCVLQPDESVRQQIASKGAKVICLNRPRPSILCPHRLIAYIINNIRDIIGLCKRERVDIIQCHLSDAEFIGVLAGRLYGAERIISTVHYPDLLPRQGSADIRNFLRRMATRMIYRWADYIVAVSEDVAKKLREVFGLKEEKIRVIVNRIDVESLRTTPASETVRASLGLDAEHRIITTVARLMPPKGHSYLLDAMAGLTAVFHNIRLLLVGDGDLRQELEKQCENRGLTEHVCFLGSREDVPDILALSELFILPSLWEGTSLALLEAMAAGKPIVATDIPGNRTVLEHRQNCLLVQPGNARALEEAVAFMLNNPDAAHAFGEKAYGVALSRFDIRRTVAELRQLWEGERVQT